MVGADTSCLLVWLGDVEAGRKPREAKIPNCKLSGEQETISQDCDAQTRLWEAIKLLASVDPITGLLGKSYPNARLSLGPMRTQAAG